MTTVAVIFGASGGIGSAVKARLESDGGYDRVIALHRKSSPPLDLLDKCKIQACAEEVRQAEGEVRLLFDATGALTLGTARPEKSLRELDPEVLARSFAINAIGPALLMKHFLPLLPREGRSVFATLSARVGSIGDNSLGGWYGYRASKAALNQLVRTASIELARKNPEAICVALHPGTVRTSLTENFAKTGLDVQEPAIAAERLVDFVVSLTPAQSGGFFDQLGRPIPW
ncbi:C factor [Stappia aggregata IAM 12614]|uniref:C factor n=1 Tax=Roseibium aggregatum (strain ATCC 25650 / DSM 13394 / JCM 20685 / NBRC 16684 / NCIMB 2208 / IAM 12614 / B1) TaxID=384765 RepID=A0NWA4_ROSAI|nr:SDR family oxidoreductase [Roseibium aggregatum]EAV42820.1 C factor [Stappia aggregata IAM 12614] [Roseibium aggregatum IAM 12614]